MDVCAVGPHWYDIHASIGTDLMENHSTEHNTVTVPHTVAVTHSLHYSTTRDCLFSRGAYPIPVRAFPDDGDPDLYVLFVVQSHKAIDRG